MSEEDYQKWQKQVLDECFRVLAPEGSMIYQHKNRIKKEFRYRLMSGYLKQNLLLNKKLSG